MTRKVGRLINESAFVALNDVTWPIRNIVQNPRSVRSSRKILNHSLFSTKFKPYKYVFLFFFNITNITPYSMMMAL